MLEIYKVITILNFFHNFISSLINFVQTQIIKLKILVFISKKYEGLGSFLHARAHYKYWICLHQLAQETNQSKMCFQYTWYFVEVHNGFTVDYIYESLTTTY